MSLPMKSGPVSIGDELIRPPERVNRRFAGIVDLAWRHALWLAYRMARGWWFIRRPAHRGALVALWRDGAVLLVLTSYRPVWSLPGGGIGPDETARAAALRELREEVGLALPAEVLRLAHEEEIFWEYRHDHVTIFEAELANPPEIRLDGREIVRARFARPEAAATLPLAPHVAHYLHLRDRGTTSSSASRSAAEI